MLTFGQASESSPSVAYFFAGCIGATLYNAVEIIVLIFATFKRYVGWYFWSLLVASLGLIATTTGFSTYFFDITPNKFVQSAVTIAGWWAFIVGQSLVLWSRLHLVLQSRLILRGVLAMIIINAIVLLIPTTVLSLGNDVDLIPEPFTRGYRVMEIIQITVFCVQEFIISGLYIWATTKLLAYTAERRKRRLMAELITMNVVLVLMDFVLMGVQYAGFRILQIVLKCFVYSIKLKFELAVLGRLTTFVQDQVLVSGVDASGIPTTVYQDPAVSKRASDLGAGRRQTWPDSVANGKMFLSASSHADGKLTSVMQLRVGLERDDIRQ